MLNDQTGFKSRSNNMTQVIPLQLIIFQYHCVQMSRLNCSRIIYKVTKLTLLFWLTYFLLSISKIKDFTISNLQPLMVKSNDINSLTLVIAHPDDEVMFFAPTLLNLNDVLPKRIPFHVVCYSNGDAEGLGDIRYKELQHSVKILLSDRDTNVTIYDHKDGMHEEWDQKLMINQLENIITIPKTTPKQNIILTFDKDGVSNHINHKTCYNASLKYFKQYEKSTILLTLNSYHRKIVMKYSSFGWECMKLLNTLFNPFASKIGETTPFNTTHITIFSTHMQYILSLASMVNAHKSQMVWYRYFWWVFSRFVYVNDLEIV